MINKNYVEIMTKENAISRKINWDVCDALRGHIVLSKYNVTLALTILYCLQEAEYEITNDYYKFEKSISDFFGDKNGNAIVEPFANCYQMFNPLIGRYTTEDIKETLLYSDFVDDSTRGDLGTPLSISELAVRVLDIKSGENVVDLCAGFGDFLLTANKHEKKANFYGVEINESSTLIANIRAKLSGIKNEIECGDVFDKKLTTTMKKFDKIFCNYPFGMAMQSGTNAFDWAEQLAQKADTKVRRSSADWVFVYLVSSMLREKGKAVAIMPMGNAFNTFDRNIRKYFVDEGLIEKVIALPEKMFAYTAIPVMMVVFSHGNKNIRFVDVSNFKTTEGRRNVFNGQILKDITILVNGRGGSYESNTVPAYKVEEKDYDLTPVKYFPWREDAEREMIRLKDVGKIKRGANILQDDLNELISDVSTKYRYVKIADVQDGYLNNKDCVYLKEVPEKYKNNCITQKCIVLSKIIQPLRVTIVEPKKGEVLLMAGNMYAIEPDEECTDMNFLKLYLESSQGVEEINLAKSGRSIPIIALRQLEELGVPKKPIAEQRRIGRIAEDYIARLHNLENQRIEINRKLKQLSQECFPKGGEFENGR